MTPVPTPSADEALTVIGLSQKTIITPPITAREKSILNALSHDLSVKMVACTLKISEHTVQDHIKNIKRKWAMHTCAGVIAFAFREGILR